MIRCKSNKAISETSIWSIVRNFLFLWIQWASCSAASVFVCAQHNIFIAILGKSIHSFIYLICIIIFVARFYLYSSGVFFIFLECIFFTFPGSNGGAHQIETKIKDFFPFSVTIFTLFVPTVFNFLSISRKRKKLVREEKK